MDKNKKLIYCIFGSVVLVLLNNPIFENARLGFWPNNGFLAAIIYLLTSTISFIGFILVMVFSIILIFYNVKNFIK
jgi:hypothetical protein